MSGQTRKMVFSMERKRFGFKSERNSKLRAVGTNAARYRGLKTAPPREFVSSSRTRLLRTLRVFSRERCSTSPFHSSLFLCIPGKSGLRGFPQPCIITRPLASLCKGESVLCYLQRIYQWEQLFIFLDRNCLYMRSIAWNAGCTTKYFREHTKGVRRKERCVFLASTFNTRFGMLFSLLGDFEIFHPSEGESR